MTNAPIRAINPDSQSETDVAWHVYAALAQYRADNPRLAENIFYNETMREAHAHWAALFGAHK